MDRLNNFAWHRMGFAGGIRCRTLTTLDDCPIGEVFPCLCQLECTFDFGGFFDWIYFGRNLERILH